MSNMDWEALYREIRKSYRRIADEYGVTMTIERIKQRSSLGENWHPGAQHWACTFHKDGIEPFVVEYSQGSGIKEEPGIADLLDCLRDDIREYRTIAEKQYPDELERYEAWRNQIVSDFGDDSAMTSVAQYRAAQKAYNGLIALFGTTGLDEIDELDSV